MGSEREEIQRRRARLHERLGSLLLGPLMRGSIVERVRKCGSAGCACSKDPSARHRSMALSVHLDGQTVSMHLRAQDEERVRRATEAYQRLWDVVNELTALEVAELRRQVRERRRARKRRP